jgi:hypothetical protein
MGEFPMKQACYWIIASLSFKIGLNYFFSETEIKLALEPEMANTKVFVTIPRPTIFNFGN